MLILSNTDRFGVDLDKLCQRILQSPCDRSRASLPHIKIREFFGSQLTCGINRCARFIDDHVLNRSIQLPYQLYDHLL